MKSLLTILISAALITAGCMADYDIAEVASPEHIGSAHHEETDECMDECETHAAEHAHEHEDTHDNGFSAAAGSDRHVHSAGERNHGTEWFFNQPWAASFIWGKILRDSIILLLLAAAILFVSGYRKKRR